MKARIRQDFLASNREIIAYTTTRPTRRLQNGFFKQPQLFPTLAKKVSQETKICSSMTLCGSYTGIMADHSRKMNVPVLGRLHHAVSDRNTPILIPVQTLNALFSKWKARKPVNTLKH